MWRIARQAHQLGSHAMTTPVATGALGAGVYAAVHVDLELASEKYHALVSTAVGVVEISPNLLKAARMHPSANGRYLNGLSVTRSANLRLARLHAPLGLQMIALAAHRSQYAAATWQVAASFG
jgi:hypothetical protein